MQTAFKATVDHSVPTIREENAREKTTQAKKDDKNALRDKFFTL